jgi:pyruvate/2-oxoglutarate dehydrogenase complex dihydrolipoamide dehydrogenase (E3) component
VPRVAFTDPEVAHVGLTPERACERGIEIETIVQQLESVDRGVLDGETGGVAKAHHRRRSDEIVRDTVVARHAGEMIGEMSLAIGDRLGLARISATIHPYPTHAEAFCKLGDAWTRSRLTPRAAKLIRAWLAWRRR